ncbi:MAG: 30S ribosomal protein S4e [Methanomicrobiaceae archaeon]|nr:30S ribosomal protein S4e [Methanomicrobiaceae archaeon]
MSSHLKRFTAPNSWRIGKKANKFITKTSPGPHTDTAIPVAVWLRDRMGIARTKKEVRKILGDRAVIVNGRPCRDPAMGLGVFDIISIPKMGAHYRILLDKKGDIVSIPISEESARTRLCKIRDKTVVKGGKVQLNLLYGANIIADGDYRPRDSVVVSLEEASRFTITDHFPYAEGNIAMVIGGRHSGKVGKIIEIRKTPGSVANRVVLEDLDTNEQFDTIEDYIFMVGRLEPVVRDWGIEG